MDTIFIFIVGCIGALAPEIVRLYNIRTQETTFSPQYYMISIIFCILGGFLAVILSSTTLENALYTGIGTPTIISTALNQSKQSTPQVKAIKLEQSSRPGVRKYLSSLF